MSGVESNHAIELVPLDRLVVARAVEMLEMQQLRVKRLRGSDSVRLRIVLLVFVTDFDSAFLAPTAELKRVGDIIRLFAVNKDFDVRYCWFAFEISDLTKRIFLR